MSRTITRLRHDGKFTRTGYPDALKPDCDKSNWKTVAFSDQTE